MAEGESERIDRWLLAARVFKTRELAAEACDGGKVDVGSVTAKPHKAVRVGDRVRVTTRAGRRELRVLALAARRLPPADALLLYEDVTPPPRPAPPTPPEPSGWRDPGSGRPSKRDRRQMSRMRWS